jgi:hypothetical protein
VEQPALLGGSEALQDRREAGEDGVEVGAEAVDREVARKMQGSTPKIRMVSSTTFAKRLCRPCSRAG